MQIRKTLYQVNYILRPKVIFLNWFANKTPCLISVFNPNYDGWVHTMVDLYLCSPTSKVGTNISRIRDFL